MCELYPLDHCFVGALTLIWIQVVLSVQLVFVCPDLQGLSYLLELICGLKNSQEQKSTAWHAFGEKDSFI